MYRLIFSLLFKSCLAKSIHINLQRHSSELLLSGMLAGLLWHLWFAQPHHLFSSYCNLYTLLVSYLDN